MTSVTLNTDQNNSPNVAIAQKSKSVSAQELVGQIFPKKVATSPNSTFSGIGLNTGYSISNFTMLERSLMDQLSAILSHLNSGLPLSKEMMDILAAHNMSVVYHAMGTTTAFHAVYAVAMLYDNARQIAYAMEIGDSQAELSGKVMVVKNITFAGGALGYAAYRPLSIASALTGASTGYTAPSLVGRATAFSGMVGNVFFTIYYGVIALLCAIQICFGEKFRGKLDKAPDQLKFLQEQLIVDAPKMLEKLLNKTAKKLYKQEFGSLNAEQKQEVMTAVQEDCIEEAKVYGSKKIAEIFKANGEKITEDDCEDLLIEMIKAQDPNVERMLLKEGFELKMRKWELKKETKLGRLTSSECVNLIKKSMQTNKVVPLNERGVVEQTSEDEIVEKVTQAIDLKRNVNIAAIVASVVGLVGMIMAIVFTGGVLAIVGAAVMILTSLLMMGVDGYCMKMSLESESPSPHDKKVLIASSIVCVLSVLTVVGLMVTGVISFGIIPLAITLILALIWLGHNIYAGYTINKKEKEHPTLENLIKFLNSNPMDDEVTVMFEKLTAEVKLHLLQQGAKKGSSAEDFKEVIQNIEKVKKEQLAKLKDEMLQYHPIPGVVTAN